MESQNQEVLGAYPTLLQRRSWLREGLGCFSLYKAVLQKNHAPYYKLL